VDEALDVLEKVEDSVACVAWRAELAAQRGVILASSGSPALALEVVEPLLGTDQPRARIRAAAAAGMAYMLSARFPEAISMVRQAYELATESVDHYAYTGDEAGLAGLCVRVTADAGYPARARAFGTAALHAAARTGDAHGHAWTASALASLELPAGNIDEAWQHAIEAAGYFRRANTPIGLGWSLAIGLMVAVHRGDLAGAGAIAGELAETKAERRQIRLYQYEIDRALACYDLARGIDPVGRLAARARYWLERGAVMPATMICRDLARLGAPDQADEILRTCSVPAEWPLGTAIVRFVRAAARGERQEIEAVAAVFSGLGFRVYAADARSVR
jgi:tetratricopeptide (TPR) repeat protein